MGTITKQSKIYYASILEELLKARKDTRKLIKTEKDPLAQEHFGQATIGIQGHSKLSYGQCGAHIHIL